MKNAYGTGFMSSNSAHIAGVKYELRRDNI